MNREEAAEYWAKTPTACISISSVARPNPLTPSLFAILRLEFDDVDPDRFKPGYEDHYKTFTIGQAKIIKSFADMVRGSNIMVHCDAGISRSAAVVEALLQYMPEYADGGGTRHPNNWVKRTLKRVLGLVPAGA